MAQDDVTNESDPEIEAAASRSDYTNKSPEFRLPQQAFGFEVTEVTFARQDMRSRDSNDMIEKAICILRCEILDPPAYAGRSYSERLIVGTDRDPLALNSMTWDEPETRQGRALVTLCIWNNRKNVVSLKGARFCAFVEWNRNNDQYTNLVDYAQYGTVTPGEVTPVRNYAASRSSRTARNAPTNAQSMANAEVPCDNCHQLFKQSELPEHMQGCMPTNLNI